jgi:hypothetical protein
VLAGMMQRVRQDRLLDWALGWCRMVEVLSSSLSRRLSIRMERPVGGAEVMMEASLRWGRGRVDVVGDRRARGGGGHAEPGCARRVTFGVERSP